MDKNIADRIKELRGETDREAFAERIGVTKSTLGRYERGDTEPTSGTIARICATFDVMADWLVLGIGEKKRGAYPVAGATQNSNLLRELADERMLNRELTSENRQLWKENGDLRVEVEKLKARAAPEETKPPKAAKEVA